MADDTQNPPQAPTTRHAKLGENIVDPPTAPAVHEPPKTTHRGVLHHHESSDPTVAVFDDAAPTILTEDGMIYQAVELLSVPIAERARQRRVTVDNQNFEHVATRGDGRWIYRAM